MQHLKIHYQIHTYGNSDAKAQWKSSGVEPDKAKFCDGLMLGIDRSMHFTKDTDYVDCKKCQKKIDTWAMNRFDLPY